MNRLTSAIILVLLIVMVNGCAPSNSSPIPTFTPTHTPLLSSTPTVTFTPVVTSAPTLTFTPSPLPASTASMGFKRVSINDFIPKLSFEVPLSLEIPQDYDWCQTPDNLSTYFWTPQKCGSFAPPKDTSYFQARLVAGMYDFQTDKFNNVPNDMNDTEMISLAESYGAKIHRIERKNIGEFPILILECELSYVDTDEAVKTQMVDRVLIAPLLDSNVLWIDFYFGLPTNLEADSPIWEHFESSFERNP